MADTVVSMARSMLGGAISVATSAAAAEMGLLVGVRKDIWFIKDELQTMQAFLEVADTRKKKDILLKVWAKQVRDLSYNIEDCLCEFMVHVGNQNLARRFMKLKDRHRIAMQIRDLKSRVEEVSIRNTRYTLIKEDSSEFIDEVNSYTEDVRNHSASNVDEADLVGFLEPKKELIKMMDVNATDGIDKVICIVGMGGLGKTTLARKIYESKEDVAKNFCCCAWITVSQSFSRIEMLKDMIRQLLGHDSLLRCLDEHKGMAVQVENLAKYLKEGLKDKRYIITLDDLWSTNAWTWIKSIAIPFGNNNGSRVILTTRDISLAKECTLESLIYYLKPLESTDATDLLLMKSGKRLEDTMKDENQKEIVAKLVKKCGCLPLAIITLGGVLATKNIAEWQKICNLLPSELERNSGLEATRWMVTLGYNHLPSYLKSCFLYLSIFPEDFEIERRRLVDRWIAEGLVRAKDGVSIEDVGKAYFAELINRNMIQASRVNLEGVVKSCRVHDVVRDVMVSISREENFVYLVGDNVTSTAEENFRHVACHGTNKYQKIGMDCSHVRSFSVFGERPIEQAASLGSLKMRMLRCLDLQDAQFGVTQEYVNNIGLMRHLKFVDISRSVGYSNIYALPRSIGKLQGLRTLVMENTHVATLPTHLGKLLNLRSVRCTRKYAYYRIGPGRGPKKLMWLASKKVRILPYWLASMIACCMSQIPRDIREEKIAELHMACSSLGSGSRGVKITKGIGNLKSLQVLEVVDIMRSSSRAVKELGKLVQLRKLSVVMQFATEKRLKVLCEAIEKLSSLSSLHVESPRPSARWLHSVSSPPLLLRSLRVVGDLGYRGLPSWFGNLTNLVKVSLGCTELKDGIDMETLGALPNLVLLRLYRVERVKDLVFRANEFRKLKKLDMYGPRQLVGVCFHDGTSPHMETIEISCCRLESGIIGISHLPRLKEISLGDSAGVAMLGALQGEMNEHQNHPALRMRYALQYHEIEHVLPGFTAQAMEESLLIPESLAGERSQLQAVIRTTTSASEEDLLYTYHSC